MSASPTPHVSGQTIIYWSCPHYCSQLAWPNKAMDGVNSNDVGHPSSHRPSLDIGSIPYSSLLDFALRILKCVMQIKSAHVLCTRSINVLCSKSKSTNLLCTKSKPINVLSTKSTNVFCNEINRPEFVSAHNHFIQIMHVIKWSSSLTLWCQNSIAQCKHLLVMRLHSHDLWIVHEYFWLYSIQVCIGSWCDVMKLATCDDYVDSLATIYPSYQCRLMIVLYPFNWVITYLSKERVNLIICHWWDSRM
jgi:hypothetical protein